MKILIDRDELVRVFKSRRDFYCDEKPESFRKLDYSDKCRVDMLDTCIADVFNMPTYEAFCNKKSLSEALENQKTGHWITKEGKEQGYDIAGVKTWYIQIMCNECGFIKTAIEGHTGQYHYCPSCGAKMEGEKE